jgi:hypothetical protein
MPGIVVGRAIIVANRRSRQMLFEGAVIAHPELLKWTRRFALALGLTAYYVAACVYNTDKLQTRIDDFWKSVYARSRLTGRVSTALFIKAVELLEEVCVILFGKILLSWRGFVASLDLSVATIALWMMCSQIHDYRNPILRDPGLTAFSAIIALICFSVVVFRAKSGSVLARVLFYLPVLLFIGIILLALGFNNRLRVWSFIACCVSAFLAFCTTAVTLSSVVEWFRRFTIINGVVLLFSVATQLFFWPLTVFCLPVIFGMLCLDRRWNSLAGAMFTWAFLDSLSIMLAWFPMIVIVILLLHKLFCSACSGTHNPEVQQPQIQDE